MSLQKEYRIKEKLSSSICINPQCSHILSCGCRPSPPRVKEMGPGKLQTQMSPTRGMQKLGAWQGMCHPVLAGVTVGSCAGWPELFQLFLCYRSKQNLLQMQCPFISHAASLPVESGPFWMAPIVGRGITGGSASW